MKMKLQVSLNDLCVAREFFNKYESSDFNSGMLLEPLSLHYLVNSGSVDKLEVADSESVRLVMDCGAYQEFNLLPESDDIDYKEHHEETRRLTSAFNNKNVEFYSQLSKFCSSILTWSDLSEFLDEETQAMIRDEYNVWEGLPLTYQNIFLIND